MCIGSTSVFGCDFIIHIKGQRSIIGEIFKLAY